MFVEGVLTGFHKFWRDPISQIAHLARWAGTDEPLQLCYLFTGTEQIRHAVS